MIELEKRLSDDLVTAMKSQKKMELSSLRMLKAELQRAKAEKGRSVELAEDDVIALIQRLVKQRREAADQYTAVGAGDRAAEETDEAVFLETYLPKQLSDNELEKIVGESGAFMNAVGPKDIGQLMGKVMTAVKGRADGKRVRSKVHDYLQSLVE